VIEARPPDVSEAPAAGALALPNLIVIGAQKCGTSSLHNYLAVHPQISMSRIKEINFFNDDAKWAYGPEWYARHFEPGEVRGESSPAYTFLPESMGTAERMHRLVPDARLIYLVRDPVERIRSNYIHMRALELESRPFGEAATDPDGIYVNHTRYATQLQPFIELFGRERLLIASQEKLFSERADTMRRIFGFLGVDESFESPEFERIWGRSEGKGKVYSSLARAAAALQARGLFPTLPRNIRWRIQKVIRADPSARESTAVMATDDVSERIAELLGDEVERLRAIAGDRFAEWSF
jgi:hypothetical protein